MRDTRHFQVRIERRREKKSKEPKLWPSVFEQNLAPSNLQIWQQKGTPEADTARSNVSKDSLPSLIRLRGSEELF